MRPHLEMLHKFVPKYLYSYSWPMSVLISQKESLFPSLKSFRSSLLVRGLISRWLHVLSWQKNVRLSTQEGKLAAESPFSPTSLAIKFKFGNMQSIS